jgi:hypothetical protein
VPRLFEIAQRGNVLGDFTHLAMEVEKQLSQAKGRALGINQDGALAAPGLDLKLDWRLMRALAFIPLGRPRHARAGGDDERVRLAARAERRGRL